MNSFGTIITFFKNKKLKLLINNVQVNAGISSCINGVLGTRYTSAVPPIILLTKPIMAMEVMIRLIVPLPSAPKNRVVMTIIKKLITAEKNFAPKVPKNALRINILFSNAHYVSRKKPYLR